MDKIRAKLDSLGGLTFTKGGRFFSRSCYPRRITIIFLLFAESPLKSNREAEKTNKRFHADQRKQLPWTSLGKMVTVLSPNTIWGIKG